MRSRSCVAITGLVAGILLLHASTAWSQFRGKGGGGPGSKGGGFSDPAGMFDRMSKGKGVILISEQNFFRDPLTKFAEENRISGGQITRDQFTAFWSVKDKYMSGGFGMGGRPPGPGPDPKGGPPALPAPGVPGPGPAAPSIDKNEALMAWAEAEFKRRDRNDDGYMNIDEVSDSMKDEYVKWDLSGDNLISLNEYRAYFQIRFQSGGRDDPGGPLPKIIIEEEDLDARPVVFRAGKLPKELPSWFNELDTDKDGQVALYEWRTAKREPDEFLTHDKNADGLITPEEALKQQAVARAASISSGTLASAGPGMSRGDDRSRSGEGKGGKGGKGGFKWGDIRVPR